MKKTIIILVLLLAFSACKNSDSAKNEKIKAASWLIGNWADKSGEGSLTENWVELNDSTFQAQSYYVKEKDTLHFESITLQQKGKYLVYNAAVKGQNNDQPVAFKLSLGTAQQLVFENLKHDYPQKISYTKITSDSMIAKISGIQQGKPSSEEFSMKKIK
jgi:hypothetical protein